MREHMKREPPRITTNRTIGLGSETTRREATQATGIGQGPKVVRANALAVAGAQQLPTRGRLPGTVIRGPRTPGV